MLAAEQLAAVRGRLTLFENLTFGLPAGQALLLRGRNGSGKTTLLRMLAGLATPSHGRVLWQGQPIREVLNAYHDALLYLGHLPAVSEMMSVRENLKAWVDLDFGQPSDSQVDDALDELQDRFTERYYGPLFGALQQRYRRTALEGVKRLLKKDLTALGETERAAIETWAEVLARRFAHIPCLGLRGLLHDGPDGSLEAFLGGLEPEFADELRAALKGAANGNGETPVAARARRNGDA